MGNANLSLQDSYLSQARQEGLMVIVYLTNGAKLEGKVKGFDNFTLVLSNNGREHLIYKHAVSTITPLRRNPAFDQRRTTTGPQKKELEALAEKYNKK